MIPILYDKDETEFTSNGLGRLRDCISCVVTEERNGIYECDFEYPINGASFEEIQVGRIIGVSHGEASIQKTVRSLNGLTDEENDNITDENDLIIAVATEETISDYDIQPFDIVSYTKPIDGVVTFHCVHISYRQSYITAMGTNINSLANAFYVLSNAEPSNPFGYQTDKHNTGYMSAGDGLPHSVRSMLGGMEGSILDAYGGEYEWDKWTVMLWESRGQVRDFSIRYGVNMLDYNEEYDTQGTYSSCIPFWTDGMVKQVGGIVRSVGQTITGHDECVPLDLSDKFEEMPTQGELEARALSYMNGNNTFIPSQNIHVEFARLQDLGYEEYGNLLECNLCDTITVVFPDYNSSAQYKIVKTVWDVLRDRYESMELGDLSTTLAEALGITQDASNTSPTIGDYVVEQGTSGIWTYRKWNSGIAECWGRYSATLSHYTTYSSFYGYTAAVNFPSGLFMSDTIPMHTYTASVGQGFAWTGSGISTSNTSITCYALAQVSGSQSCVFDITAKGRWK